MSQEISDKYVRKSFETVLLIDWGTFCDGLEKLIGESFCTTELLLPEGRSKLQYKAREAMERKGYRG